MNEQAQRQAVIDEAKSWLRTPYHHRQRVKGVGVDCGMLLIAVYSACGLSPDFDPGEYPADWMMHRDEERYLSWVRKFAADTDKPLPGDIALWRFGRCVSHGAIVVDWPNVIHAYKQERMCVLGNASIGDFEKRVPMFFTLWGEK